LGTPIARTLKPAVRDSGSKNKITSELENNMNIRTTALLAFGALLAPTSMNADIVLTEDLSLSGYLDIYALDYDAPGDNSKFDVAEFELDISFTTEPFFSVVELSFNGSGESVFETAIISWNATDQLSFTAGNILSYLGWETYDATGLFQFSYAYRDFSPLYPAYAVGAAMDFVTDDYSIGFWVGDAGDNDISIEVAGKYKGIENVTIFGAIAEDPGYTTLNVWGSYSVSNYTFALEWVDVDRTSGPDSTGYLGMVNYAWDQAAVTFRYSIEETDTYPFEKAEEDWKLFTISPSYSFSDNLLGLLELDLIQSGSPGDWQLAAEVLYTF
jgi:hypothetical protein